MDNLAVSYERVSTKKQARQGYSLDNQLNLNKERCAQDGYTIAQSFCDAGFSGQKGKRRDEFDNMMKYLDENTHITRIYTYSIDRLGRTQSALFNFYNWAEERGIEIYCIKEQFMIDPKAKKDMMQVIIRSIFSMLAQVEVIRTEERSEMGREAAKRLNVKFGPKSKAGGEPLVDKEQVVRLLSESKYTIPQIAVASKCSVRQLYRIKKEAFEQGLLAA